MGSAGAIQRLCGYAINKERLFLPVMSGNNSKSTIRIIGGEWRGRRLPVLNLPGLRPSGDRCRETLFNWLQAYVPGAVCADLFAGSGALGLEASSRGAESVVMIEKNSAVVSCLDLNINHLHATRVRVQQSDALDWLSRVEPDSLDIVFVDPPFDEGLSARVMGSLDERRCVRAGGLVYFETSSSVNAVATLPGWESWREKTMGRVRMQLFRRAA
jgi:16S rRNA (guanine966-N2)-methyltransferase